jgi:hypothetical protein
MILEPFRITGKVAVVTGKVLEVDGGTIASSWPFPIPNGLQG